MSDDEKKKDDKKEAKAEAKDAKGGKAGGSMVGIILGVVILAGVGAGAGMYVVKALAPAPVEKPAAGDGHGGDAHGGDAHGATADAHGAEDAHGAAAGGHGGLLETGVEIGPIDLKANITGSGGTRYVTLSVGIWVPKADQPKYAELSVLRLIQARLEETLCTYQLEDLQSPNIKARMKKDFGVAVERLLRSVMPGRPAEQKFVLDVVATGLLTQ